MKLSDSLSERLDELEIGDERLAEWNETAPTLNFKSAEEFANFALNMAPDGDLALYVLDTVKFVIENDKEMAKAATLKIPNFGTSAVIVQKSRASQILDKLMERFVGGELYELCSVVKRLQEQCNTTGKS